MTAPTESILGDLEESFTNDIPCGGNRFPVEHPCPHNRAAVVRQEFLCDCPPDHNPKCFKCIECYTEFLIARTQKYAHCKMVQCEKCDKVMPAPPGTVRYVAI